MHMQTGIIVSTPEPREAPRMPQRRQETYGDQQGKTKKVLGKRKSCAELSDGWLACFFACELLARRHRPSTLDQSLWPSGARIFYYTTLALKRQELFGSPGHSRSVLSWGMTDAFLATALKVAAGLQCSYAAAVRLRRTPLIEGARLLNMVAGYCKASDLGQAPYEILHRHRSTVATSTRPSVSFELLLATLVGQFLAERIPISPVARAQDAMPVALRLLKAQLAEEAVRIKQVPASEMYLYEEPLHLWLGRLVQAHPWIRDVLPGPQERRAFPE